MGQNAEKVALTAAETLHQRGRQEGRMAGLREALLRVLQRRFGEIPEETLHRIEGADLPTLERCLDRAIEAATLEEVIQV